MLYEIVNPYDPYTIEANSFDVAVVACAILGSGQYAFRPVGEGEEVPMFFGDQDKICQKHFGKNFDEVMEGVTNSKKAELADCLDSVLIGTEDAREDFFNGRDPNETREAFEKVRFERHDKRRSSFNDIGGRAYRMAAKLREGITTVEKAPQQVFVG